MIVYAACSGMMFPHYPELKKRFTDTGRMSELRSYWELWQFSGHTLPVWGQPYFLDSGAFSAWSQKSYVTPANYAKWVKKYNHQLTGGYANIDGIPKTQDKAGFEASAQETWDNQMLLEELGIEPIPVFHKGEDYKWLAAYLDRGYEYICLGGLVSDGAAIENKTFFDHVWKNYLTNRDGSPKVKVHGFGMTDIALMRAYPWFSCDSSTWLIQSKTGSIMIPKFKKDGSGYDYNQKGDLIPISDKSSRQNELGKHYDSLSPLHQDRVKAYLKELDVDLELVRTHPSGRFIVNLEFWCNVQEHCQWSTRYRPREVELL